MSRAVVRDIGWIKVKRDAMKFSGLVIGAGLFSDAGEHDGVPLAQIGFWQNFGTEHIPARDWLTGGAEFTEKVALNHITRIVRRLGSISEDPLVLLQPVASAVAEGIKDYAINTAWQPNAESTIKKKGFNWPLVQTGAMIDAISGRVKRYARSRSTLGGE